MCAYIEVEMHEEKLWNGEIVGKLSIEIDLRKKLFNNWFVIVIKQNESKTKKESKQILFYCQP